MYFSRQIRVLLTALLCLVVPLSLAAQPPAEVVGDTETTTADPAVAAAKLSYNLQSAVARGVTHYPGLEIARKATAAVRTQLSEARHSWILPKLEVTSLFGPVPEVPASAGPPNFPNIDQDLNHSDGLFFRMEIEAIQPLYTFGRLSNVTRLAKTGFKAAQENEREELHELILNIKRAYFALASLYTIEAFLREIDLKLGFVEKRIDAMVSNNSAEVTESDRLKVQIFRADLTARQLEAQENQTKLRQALALLLGYGTDVEQWEIDDRNIAPVNPESFDLQRALEWTRSNNPKLRQLGYLVDAKKALHDISQANMLPLFFLGGNFAYAVAPGRFDVDNPYLFDPFNELTGGAALGLRQQLDLHILNDRRRRAKIEYEQALYQRRLAEDAILADLRNRVVGVDLSQKRYLAATEGLRAARSWVGAELNNYEFGLAPTKDVLEAFIAYAKTKLEFVDTTAKYNLAVAGLTRVTFRELLPDLKYQGDGR